MDQQVSRGRLYARGAYFERRVKKHLTDAGLFVVRSAGSKGVYDLIAVHPMGRPIGIQCKIDGKCSREERKSMVEVSISHNVIPAVAYRIPNRRRNNIGYKLVDKSLNTIDISLPNLIELSVRASRR